MRSISAAMDITTQLELHVHEQTQILANAACKVGSHLTSTLKTNY